MHQRQALLLFLFALLLGILTALRWGKDKRLAITSMLVLVLALWAMLSQLYALQNWDVQGAILGLLVESAHPLRNIYIFVLVFVVPLVALPILMVYKSEKTLGIILDMVGRISLLTMFYLLLDFMALIVVVFRNI